MERRQPDFQRDPRARAPRLHRRRHSQTVGSEHASRHGREPAPREPAPRDPPALVGGRFAGEALAPADFAGAGLPATVTVPGGAAVTTPLSTPVRLTAVTSTRVGSGDGRRCVRTAPGRISVVHAPSRSVRTVHSHGLSLAAGISATTGSLVAGSRFSVATGRPGALAPSHGDAGGR